MYVFGNPRAQLTTRVQARLLVMRGYILDAKRGAEGGPADGDIDWLTQTPAGIFVPLPDP